MAGRPIFPWFNKSINLLTVHSYLLRPTQAPLVPEIHLPFSWEPLSGPRPAEAGGPYRSTAARSPRERSMREPAGVASEWGFPLGLYRWLSARLQYRQCISNGDTAVLHWAIHIMLCILVGEQFDFDFEKYMIYMTDENQHNNQFIFSPTFSRSNSLYAIWV